MARQVYCTSYCNWGHCLKTGKPIAHECYILPPRALELERAGDIERAIQEMLYNRGPIHPGLKPNKSERDSGNFFPAK